ncbi:xylulokinase [candidate division KSB1 bacterium]|nr:xylulokinase [candidate division KSB1 bacterium]
MEQYFIGIDSGTQGTKALIVDRGTRRIISDAYSGHKIIEDNKGTKEQEPHWWIAACEEAISKALKRKNLDPGKVVAIGVSGQQHGMVPLDSEGSVLRPAKLWCDTATTKEADAITAKLGGAGKVIDKIGNSIAVGFTASKILWFKEHAPEKYEQLDCVLLPHEYINFWLTGERKAEYGDASGTAYFDVRKRCWSKEVLNTIDPTGKLENCLPQLIESHDPVGKIRKEVAAKFGFSEDVIVSSGGGDNMMAAIGTGNVAPGVVTASLGTSGTIYCFSEEPVVDPQGELAAFCSSDGNWLPLVCTMNVTVATELTRALFDLNVEQLNERIAASQAGANGLILLPYFNGERTPALPTAKATIYGMDSTNYNNSNVCRAAMEGATFGLRYGLDVFKRQGITPAEIRLVGGGSKSAIWRQIVADIFACPVVCPTTEEAGALGAALQAVWCHLNSTEEKTPLKQVTDEFVSLDESSRVEPQPENVILYKQIYEKYLHLNNIMSEFYNPEDEE